MDINSDLILRSVDDPTCFAEVFDQCHDLIFRYLARRVGTEPAGDLASEVFARAFRLRGAFDPTLGNGKAWIYGIATNVLSEHRRAEQRNWRRLQRIRGLRPVGDDAVGLVDDGFEAVDRYRQTLQHLAALPSDQRDALVLIAWEGLSYQEAAAALGCPVGTIRSRVSRARTALQTAEQGHGGPTGQTFSDQFSSNRELDGADAQVHEEHKLNPERKRSS